MIVGGNEKQTEVIGFNNYSRSTPCYGELPYLHNGAVGTMLGYVPIVCGGDVEKKF